MICHCCGTAVSRSTWINSASLLFDSKLTQRALCLLSCATRLLGVVCWYMCIHKCYIYALTFVPSTFGTRRIFVFLHIKLTSRAMCDQSWYWYLIPTWCRVPGIIYLVHWHLVYNWMNNQHGHCGVLVQLQYHLKKRKEKKNERGHLSYGRIDFEIRQKSSEIVFFYACFFGTGVRQNRARSLQNARGPLMRGICL